MMEGYEKYEEYKLGTTSRTDEDVPYTCYCVGGIVNEGNKLGHWSTSKSDTKKAFDAMFNNIALKHVGEKIFWRRFPEWSERTVWEEDFKDAKGLKRYKEVTLYQITARFAWERGEL